MRVHLIVPTGAVDMLRDSEDCTFHGYKSTVHPDMWQVEITIEDASDLFNLGRTYQLNYENLKYLV